MTDRELLEQAAKAAGIDGVIGNDCEFITPDVSGAHLIAWNPLTDDGDALRLAEKLGMTVNFHTRRVTWNRYQMTVPEIMVFCEEGQSMNDVIVHVAAQIGRAMP